MLVPPARDEPDYQDAVVVSIDDSTVTLHPKDVDPKRATKPGRWGLQWKGGYGQIGRILSRQGQDVRREFVRLRGAPPPGVAADVDAFAFNGTPKEDLDLDYQEVEIPTELGKFPAWLIPGKRRTWVIFVHGKGANREEALRALGAVSSMGFPCLVITYRNDPEARPSPDHRYHYGRTEWRDLDSAVDYATGHGARDFALVGYSFGGAIILNFVSSSPRATRARGLVLEAPPIQLEVAVDHGLDGFKLPFVNAPLPQFARGAAKALAEIRYGMRWSAYDLTEATRKLAVPVLLLHGDQDTVVPFATSERLARSRPDIVTFERFPGAGHVECWNVDPARYRLDLTRFLSSVAARALS